MKRLRSAYEELTKKQKKLLTRIVLAGVLLIAAELVPAEGLWRLPLFLVPYLIAGWPVLRKAGVNIAHGQVFDENFLMSLATIGALILGEYAEAAGVMLFFQVGELFENVAVERSRRSISSLMDIRPDIANLLRGDETVEVDPAEVAVGETILVRPGERVPLDGVITFGSSALDTAALTGESLPRDVTVGAEALSGCVNLTGVLHIEVTRPFEQSTASRILELVESASERKAQAESFITKFARYYTPAVVIGAVALAIIPPLFVGGFAEWARRALIFLVISCPCALVISVPLAFFGAIGGASRQGVLIKGGGFFERLNNAGAVVFDKTGTLTRGEFTVTAAEPAEGVTEDTLLMLAALAETHSTHPIARALCRAYAGEADSGRVTDVREEPGFGVDAIIDGVPVYAGNERQMARHGIKLPGGRPAETGASVYIARDGAYMGRCVVADTLKPTSADVIQTLRQRGITTIMLTGDTIEAGTAVASALGLDHVYTQLLPGDKVDRLEQHMAATKEAGKTLVYVGDGVNDAPVLARADVGVAMGALGSDAAIEAADVVLMDDDPARLLTAMGISRKCMRIVRENIVFSLAVKGLFLLLGAAGIANMWEAVFADVGVAVIAIVNASRMLRTQNDFNMTPK